MRYVLSFTLHNTIKMKKTLIPFLALLFAVSFSCTSEATTGGIENGGNPEAKALAQTTPDVVTPPAPPAKTEKVTEISFAETDFNFGEVKQGVPARHTFTFTNTGDKDLIIENVKPSCSCTAPSWTKEPVKPGETGEITAEFNAKSKGVFNKSVTVTSNGSDVPMILKIKGEVLAADAE